jgi:transcriptional regulator with XRE-family HTH domain
MNGAELRRLRQRSQMTQDVIAERMGVSRQAVSLIEGRSDVQADTTARYIGAMHELEEVEIRTHIVFSVQERPIYHEKTSEAVKVKAG